MCANTVILTLKKFLVNINLDVIFAKKETVESEKQEILTQRTELFCKSVYVQIVLYRLQFHVKAIDVIFALCPNSSVVGKHNVFGY